MTVASSDHSPPENRNVPMNHSALLGSVSATGNSVQCGHIWGNNCITINLCLPLPSKEPEVVHRAFPIVSPQKCLVWVKLKMTSTKSSDGGNSSPKITFLGFASTQLTQFTSWPSGDLNLEPSVLVHRAHYYKTQVYMTLTCNSAWKLTVSSDQILEVTGCKIC